MVVVAKPKAVAVARARTLSDILLEVTASLQTPEDVLLPSLTACVVELRVIKQLSVHELPSIQHHLLRRLQAQRSITLKVWRSCSLLVNMDMSSLKMWMANPVLIAQCWILAHLHFSWALVPFIDMPTTSRAWATPLRPLRCSAPPGLFILAVIIQPLAIGLPRSPSL